MFDDMNRWTDFRLAVLSGEISIREAVKKYNLNWRTIRKTLEHVEPPDYRRKVERPKKTLGGRNVKMANIRMLGNIPR